MDAIQRSHQVAMRFANTGTNYVFTIYEDGNSNGVATCDVGAYEVVPPDLSISYMADSPDPVQPGASLIYTIDVNNPGPNTLANLELTDHLPAGAAVVSAVLALASTTAAQNELPTNVSPADADNHIIRRVEPTVPPLATFRRKSEV